MNNILLDIRQKKGLTQKDMAEHLKINLNTYKSYEYGTRTVPSEVMLNTLKMARSNAKYRTLYKAFDSIVKYDKE